MYAHHSTDSHKYHQQSLVCFKPDRLSYHTQLRWKRIQYPCLQWWKLVDGVQKENSGVRSCPWQFGCRKWLQHALWMNWSDQMCDWKLIIILVVHHGASSLGSANSKSRAKITPLNTSLASAATEAKTKCRATMEVSSCWATPRNCIPKLVPSRCGNWVILWYPDSSFHKHENCPSGRPYPKASQSHDSNKLLQCSFEAASLKAKATKFRAAGWAPPTQRHVGYVNSAMYC